MSYRQGPHFCNSVDCFIKSPTSAKNSEFAFNKIFIFVTKKLSYFVSLKLFLNLGTIMLCRNS